MTLRRTPGARGRGWLGRRSRAGTGPAHERLNGAPLDWAYGVNDKQAPDNASSEDLPPDHDDHPPVEPADEDAVSREYSTAEIVDWFDAEPDTSPEARWSVARRSPEAWSSHSGPFLLDSGRRALPPGDGWNGLAEANGPPGRARVTAADVARRWPAVVIVPALVLMIVGAALGLLRSPTYTASDQAGVQIVSSDSAALGGITEATVAQAATFARAATSDQVINSAARALGLRRSQIAGTVSATPVAMSGNITVRATASSAARAVRVVNAATDSLRAYVASATNTASRLATLLAQYQAANADAHRLSAALARLVGQTGTAAGSATQSAAVNQAYAAVQAANLQVDTLKSTYQSALSAPVTRLNVFARATSASSDKKSTTALLGVLGLVVGLSVGFGLCALRAPRLQGSPRPA